MEPWRAQFFLNSISGRGSHGYCETSKGRKKMLQIGLLSHLEDEKFNTCPVHFGIKIYVMTLYQDYIKTSGNKGEYSVWDVNYKTSEVEVVGKSHTNNELQSLVKTTPETKKPEYKKIVLQKFLQNQKMLNIRK